jgi:hypothetical protein
MNYYPGQGLVFGTAVLGSPLGRVYATTTAGTLCKIHGKLKDVEGKPAGVMLPSFVDSSGFEWQGIQVTARLTAAETLGDDVITLQSVSTETAESGYFEFRVLQGLSVIVSAPVLDKSVTVITTGQTSIDISAYF